MHDLILIGLLFVGAIVCVELGHIADAIVRRK